MWATGRHAFVYLSKLLNPGTHMRCSQLLWQGFQRAFHITLITVGVRCCPARKLHMVFMQGIAQDSFELLHTVAARLRQWVVNAGRRVQQQQLTDRKQQPNEPPESADRLIVTCIWLLVVAKDLLHTIWRQELCIAMNQPLLLDTVGQLVHRVRGCLSPKPLVPAPVLSRQRC